MESLRYEPIRPLFGIVCIFNENSQFCKIARVHSISNEYTTVGGLALLKPTHTHTCNQNNIHRKLFGCVQWIYGTLYTILLQYYVLFGVGVMTTLIFNIILCTLVFQLDGRMLAGQMKRVSGGVGRNIADALGRFGHDVCFLTAVGDDSDGRSIIQSLEHIVSIYYYYYYYYYHRRPFAIHICIYLAIFRAPAICVYRRETDFDLFL